MEKYQTIGSRFLALLIDSLLAIPVTRAVQDWIYGSEPGAVATGFPQMSRSLPPPVLTQHPFPLHSIFNRSIIVMILANLFNTPKINFVLTFAMSAVPILYTILIHNFYGQTLGKIAMKVKVLDISERQYIFD
ncbi:hypothetical protein BH20ACI4_BH20ACI4_30340 [soil metagenome]